MAIPRIIHQTYHSREFPAAIEASVKALRERNPGWEYRFYDDADIERFIRAEYEPEVYAAYSRINPAYGAARADLFRYLLIYRLGGVYLDIKSSATAPLDDIISPLDRHVLAYWPNGPGEPFAGWGMHAALADFHRGEFQNWHLISTPRHPFLHAIIISVLANIRQYDPERSGVGQLGVLATTGPIAYTLAIRPILSSTPHRLAGSHLDMGLVYNCLGEQGVDAHHSLFKTHYSRLREPVILPASGESIPRTRLSLSV